MENPQTSKKQEASETAKVELSCASCGVSGSHLMRCSRCKKVFYCNVDCQRANFKTHKLVCELAPVQVQPIKQKPFGIDSFVQLEHVGTGNFSTIFKGKSKIDGKVYAIKQVEKMKLKRMEKQADIIMEKHCLTKLKEWPYSVQIERTFQDEVNLYIQMEFASNGQVWQQSKTFGTISQSIGRYFFHQIVVAMSELHNKFDIVHRDIKPQNILLDENNRIKFVDFGTAKDISRPDIKGSGNGLKKRKVFENFVGTPNYMPPETIHNTASEKVSDVYSLAGVFYFLKTGFPPFTGGSQYLIFQKSLNKPVYIPPDSFDKHQQDLLVMMLEKDYKTRADINKVLEHQYFRSHTFPETYQQALSQSTKEQIYLMKLAKQIDQPCRSADKPLQQRLKIFEQVSLKAKQWFEKAPEQYSREYLKSKLSRMLLGGYCMLNIEDDNCIGFQEVNRKYNGTDKFKIQFE